MAILWRVVFPNDKMRHIRGEIILVYASQFRRLRSYVGLIRVLG